VLGGFDRSVALLRRDARTQALTPVRGRGGCVDERPAARTGCSAATGLGAPQSFAFSPDGRFAYAPAGDVLSVIRITGSSPP
jgi:hypothetical protein